MEGKAARRQGRGGKGPRTGACVQVCTLLWCDVSEGGDIKDTGIHRHRHHRPTPMLMHTYMHGGQVHLLPPEHSDEGVCANGVVVLLPFVYPPRESWVPFE
jgi:hypothetical protein